MGNANAVKKGNMVDSLLLLAIIAGVVSVSAVIFVMGAVLNEKFVSIAYQIVGTGTSSGFNSTVNNSQNLLATTSSLAVMIVLGVIAAAIIAVLFGAMAYLFVFSRGGGMGAR